MSARVWGKRAATPVEDEAGAAAHLGPPPVPRQVPTVEVPAFLLPAPPAADVVDIDTARERRTGPPHEDPTPTPSDPAHGTEPAHPTPEPAAQEDPGPAPGPSAADPLELDDTAHTAHTGNTPETPDTADTPPPSRRRTRARVVDHAPAAAEQTPGTVPWLDALPAVRIPRVRTRTLDALMTGPATRTESVFVPPQVARAVRSVAIDIRRATGTKVTHVTVMTWALAHGIAHFDDVAPSVPADGRRAGGYPITCKTVPDAERRRAHQGSRTKIQVTDPLLTALNDVVDREQLTRDEDAPSRQGIVLTALAVGLRNCDQWQHLAAASPIAGPPRRRTPQPAHA